MSTLRGAALLSLMATAHASLVCGGNCGDKCCPPGSNVRLEGNECVLKDVPFRIPICDVCKTGGGGIPQPCNTQLPVVESSTVQLERVLLRKGSQVWRDISSAVVAGLPDFLDAQPFFMPPSVVPASSEVEFKCTTDVLSCDAFVFVYGCGQCEAQNGGLPEELHSDGWQRSSCVPTFARQGRSDSHRLLAYRKTVANRETVKVTVPRDARFVAFTILPYPSTRCEDRTTQQQCTETIEGSAGCRWAGRSGCVENYCPRAMGPQPAGCQVCVSRDF